MPDGAESKTRIFWWLFNRRKKMPVLTARTLKVTKTKCTFCREVGHQARHCELKREKQSLIREIREKEQQIMQLRKEVAE